MTDYLKQTLKTDLCQSFTASFQADSDDRYFLFMGRPNPWTDPYDDNNVPTAQDTLKEDLEAWRNMTAVAKLNKKNVIVGVARYEWEYNKVFDPFDDSVDLYEEGNEKLFYCITSDYNVYKCLGNNYGSPSTIQPTAITSSEQVTADGYVWKFMFKVREELYDFLTDDFIPIEKLDDILYTDERSLQNNVKIGSKPGAIYSVLMSQFGGSYPLAIVEDGAETDLRHIVTEIENNTSFKVFPSSDLVKVDDTYNDYYEFYIAEGTGAGQKSVITDYEYSEDDGSITITVSDPLNVSTDSIFRIYPRVDVVGDGSDASVIPVMNNEDKLITSFIVLNGGTNYRYATIDVYRKNSAYSNKTLGRVVLSPVNGHGFDAIRELGANMVMMYIPMRVSEKLLDPNAASILKNDYRQIGIVKNLVYNNDDMSRVGSEEVFKTFLRIENVNSKSVIYLVSGDAINTILSIGDYVKQGAESNTNQARGIVESVVKTEQGSTDLYTITVANTNGRFESSSASTYPLILDSDSDTELGGTITNVIVSDLFNTETFEVGNYILGGTTASTAKIEKWEVDVDGLAGSLYYTELKGKFNNSYYSKTQSGEIILVRGENIVGYESLDVETGQLVGISPATVGVVIGAGTEESDNKLFYKVSTTLTLYSSGGTLTESTFTADDVIETGNGATAVVISYDYTDSQNGSLEVTGITGNLVVGSSLTIVTVTETATGAVIANKVSPDILPYYGDIVYIQNVTPISVNNDSEEHIKILIKF